MYPFTRARTRAFAHTHAYRVYTRIILPHYCAGSRRRRRSSAADNTHIIRK